MTESAHRAVRSTRPPQLVQVGGCALLAVWFYCPHCDDDWVRLYSALLGRETPPLEVVERS